MQAALMLGSKSRVAGGGKLRKLGGRLELPSNVATKEIAPFPRYPPESWGRAAWLERGRRCSVQESQQQAAACHRRWVKGNRIQDASLGGSSDDEDFLGVLRGPSTFANAFLYVGLGTIALGLVIAFVGTGEKGFKTVELRLIGPSLIGIGFICCLLRILFCICPSHCISTKKNARKKNGNKVDADHTTSLLRGESKRVSIARGPGQQPRYPITHKRSNSKMLNEGMEALRQIATTSLFMQNEQKPMTNRIVPIIKEPENLNADIPEASSDNNKKSTENAPTMSTNADEEDIVSSPNAAIDKESTNTTAVYQAHLKQSQKKEEKDCSTNSGFSNKLSRQRISVHQPSPTANLVTLNENSPPQEMETSLMFVKNPKLTTEMLTPQIQSKATTTTTANATVTNLNYSLGDNTFIPPIHAPSSVAKSSLLTARQTSISGLSATTTATTTTANATTINTASTYAAALAAAISSRGNTERTEGLIRGPLGMPMHVLAASSSTYALPASAPSTCTVRTSVSAPLPAPTTAPSILTTNINDSSTCQQSIPGQVVHSLPLIGTTPTTVPNSISTKSTLNELSYNNNSTNTTLKFPAASMLSSTSYSDSSSTLSPNSLIGSTSFTMPTSQTTIGAKHEPELLLSPAKLGQ